MKKLLLMLFVSFLTFFSFSQTPVNVYVVHQGCPYTITNTWSSQCGAGNMVLDSVDYLGFQDLYFYQISDTCYPIQLTMCVYVTPTQTINCSTQTINGGGAITLLADCSILTVDEINITKQIVKIVDLSGKEVNETYKGFVIIYYKNGEFVKTYQF